MKTHLRINTKAVFVIIFLLVISIHFPAQAGVNAMLLAPATDQGNYLMVEQSQTLGKYRFAFGALYDLSVHPVILSNAAGVKIQDVIQYQLEAMAGASVGLTPWLNVGLNVPVVMWQNFITPTTLVQDNGFRRGDLGFNIKARLLDNNTFPVGIAVMPFVTVPTGDQNYFAGDDNVTVGGKVIVDTKKINDRVSFSLNLGAKYRAQTTINPGGNVMGSELLYGGAANIDIIKPLQAIVEVDGATEFNDLFQRQSRSLEAIGALRYFPEKNHAFLITAGGGAGLMESIGSPDYRVFLSMGLRGPEFHKKATAVVTPPPVKEEVITTHEIHFAFNKAVIQAESYPVIETILSGIKGRSEVLGVRVEGHTDSVGSDAYNQKLSQARASAVKAFLVGKSYPADKIEAVGKGETTPMGDNNTVSGRALNRRVEFHLLLPANTKIKLKKSSETSPVFEESSKKKAK